MKVQDELAGTENRINVAAHDYNAAVTDYNTTRNPFPAVLTAGLLGFKEEPFFQAEGVHGRHQTIGDANAMRRISRRHPHTAAPAESLARY